jgi:hypothetical protein
MNKITLLEVLDAAHLSKHVNGPYTQRGGIMILGPPATLKTTFIKNALEDHHDALVLSDVNIQTLISLRDDLRTGRYNTLAFTELEKLYQRRADTASNIEGSLKQMVEEGFHRASFEDQRLSISKTRCMVIGAMTNDFYARHFDEWEKSGFARRFLWCNIELENAYKLMDAVAAWELLSLGEYRSKSPGNKSIPYNVTKAENDQLRLMLKTQRGTITPFVLLKKILCVLKWKYGKREHGKPMRIMRDFSECLTDHGAQIHL